MIGLLPRFFVFMFFSLLSWQSCFALATPDQVTEALLIETVELESAPTTPWIIEKSGRYVGKGLITVRSEHGPAVIIRAAQVELDNFVLEAPQGEALFVDRAKKLTLKNLNILNSNTAIHSLDGQLSLKNVKIGQSEHLAVFEGSNTLAIVDSQFVGPFKSPLQLRGSTYAEINNTKFDWQHGPGLELEQEAVMAGHNLQIKNCLNGCLKLFDRSHLHLSTSQISGAQGPALVIQGQSQAIIQEAKIANADVGIIAGMQSQTILQNSHLQQFTHIAILAIEEARLRLEFNRLEQATVGLKLKDASHAMVAKNDFLQFNGVAISVTEQSEIRGQFNRLIKNQGSALLVKTSGPVHWSENIHQQNLLQGMEIIDFDQGEIRANLITHNGGDGLYIEKMINPNAIRENIIEVNSACNVELPRHLVSLIVANNTIEDAAGKICALPKSDE